MCTVDNFNSSNEQPSTDVDPLTPEQIDKIKEVSSATNIPDENFTQRLFDVAQ